jgi:hypothetical protein
MTSADVQLLVAQARIEADNPAFKVSNHGRVVAASRGRTFDFYSLFLLKLTFPAVHQAYFPV